VHEEAERLEHFISERFEDRVAAILGDPELDPHGHVIPPKHAAGVFRDEVPLAGWPLQTPGVISSVSDRSAANLRALERLGLMHGTALVVEQRNASGSLSIKLDDRPEIIRLSVDLARSILVAQNPVS
jgi:DtxR family Mn-dependent transcriptional regulator